MALQHHFVVMIENGVATIDHEVSVNFDGGAVWDTEEETWESSYDHASEYEAAMEQLTNLLIPTWRDN